MHAPDLNSEMNLGNPRSQSPSPPAVNHNLHRPLTEPLIPISIAPTIDPDLKRQLLQEQFEAMMQQAAHEDEFGYEEEEDGADIAAGLDSIGAEALLHFLLLSNKDGLDLNGAKTQMISTTQPTT